MPPSPNLRDYQQYLHPSLCLLKAHNQVGRGTDFSFKVFGHPILRKIVFMILPPKVGYFSLLSGKKCNGFSF
ncbi:MAG: DUF1343 domain-containing protein [Bacteroidetes bacterium]|nr:DUF1343 domain-containing protein [Bacteroidota bacterium]